MITLSKSKLNILVAFTNKNRYIAKGTKMPWKRLSVDFAFMNHIMELDKNVVIILGRKTLEVAKYTKYDKIVLSRNTHDKSDKTTYVKSFDEALKAAGNRTVIVAGGQEIYSEALKRDYKLFITVIEEDEMVGDRIFPVEDEALLNKVNVTDEFVVECNAKKEKYSMKDGFVVENGHKFRFYTVEK